MKKKLSAKQREELLNTLKDRFGKNMNRHKGVEWTKVQAKLDMLSGEEKLWSLNEMENTGGEPDLACRLHIFSLLNKNSIGII